MAHVREIQTWSVFGVISLALFACKIDSSIKLLQFILALLSTACIISGVPPPHIANLTTTYIYSLVYQFDQMNPNISSEFNGNYNEQKL